MWLWHFRTTCQLLSLLIGRRSQSLYGGNYFCLYCLTVLLYIYWDLCGNFPTGVCIHWLLNWWCGANVENRLNKFLVMMFCPNLIFFTKCHWYWDFSESAISYVFDRYDSFLSTLMSSCISSLLLFVHSRRWSSSLFVVLVNQWWQTAPFYTSEIQRDSFLKSTLADLETSAG